ncbi:hypothetical protein ACWGMA_20710 [Streptomyces asiaticus]|nr:hypothetical protein [Streptomyces sp. AgN23]
MPPLPDAARNWSTSSRRWKDEARDGIPPTRCGQAAGVRDEEA